MTYIPQRLAYSIHEAAALLSLSVPTIERMIAVGDIETFRQGRRRLISAAALQRWIKAKETSANELSGPEARNVPN